MGSRINMVGFFPKYQRSAEVSTWICFSNVVSSAPLDLTHMVATLVYITLFLIFFFFFFLFVILRILNLFSKSSSSK